MKINDYLVHVVGNTAAKVVHESYAEAEKEAKRLSELKGNEDKAVVVLKVVSGFFPIIKPTHEFKRGDL